MKQRIKTDIKLPTENKKYYLGEKFPKIYFTLREAQCMKYFLKYFSNAKVGQLLKLSSWTIDFYLSNMKLKLNAKTKSQLIKQVKKSDFRKQLKLIDIDKS